MTLAWKEASSIGEAEINSGVLFPALKLQGELKDMELLACFWMKGLMEVRYENSRDDQLILRKTTRKTEHLSGDYSSYPETFDLACRDVILHCKGTRARISCAEFDPFGCSVSILMNPGMPGNGLTEEDLLRTAEAFLPRL